MVETPEGSGIYHLRFDLLRFFELYSGSFVPIFKYSIFLKNQTVFKWNGAIIPLTWIKPGNEKQDVIDSLKVYAEGISNESQRNYLLNIADSMFDVATVVYDDFPGNIRLFNGYDSDGNPSDLNLNMQNGNPALFTSREGDYPVVRGCVSVARSSQLKSVGVATEKEKTLAVISYQINL